MKEKILHKASELFLNYGFKSVTMDEISEQLGISKKTLYKHYENKHILVNDCVSCINTSSSKVIKNVQKKNFNAIEENFKIKDAIREMFRTAVSSPIYQLKKYYPKIYEKARKKQEKIFNSVLSANNIKGIKEKYYREDINSAICTQFYFALVFSINENSNSKKEIHELETKALEYHTRAIATEKGIVELEKQLKIYNNK